MTLVKRDFTSAAPNELWLTGNIERPTSEGKLYLCPVKDVDSGIRWTADEALAGSGSTGERDEGTQPCLGSAFGWCSPVRRITSSPRAPRVDGRGRGLRGQRRDGIVLLTAAKNVLDSQCWLTRQDLRLTITTWIERTYHRRRRQRRLGKLTPIEQGKINQTALTAA